MTTLEYISQSGLLGIGAIAALLAYKYFNNMLSQKRITNPLNHCFFDKIKYERHIHLKNIRIIYKKKYCPVRTKMFIDMMDKKFFIWKTITREFISDMLKEKPDQDVLRNKSTESIQKIIEGYESAWLELGVPEDVVIKFREWHSSRVKLLIDVISPICTSDCYSSLKEKLNAILEIHKVLITITILDVEQTLGSMNGELSGIKYKSFILE